MFHIQQKLPLFIGKNGDLPKLVLDFLGEKTHIPKNKDGNRQGFHRKKRNDNNGNPWKSSRILHFSFFICFIFFIFFIFPVFPFFFFFFFTVFFFSFFHFSCFFFFFSSLTLSVSLVFSFSSIFLFFQFCLFFYFSIFLFFFFIFFFFFQSSKQTPKPAKNRREVPIVKKTIFLCENLILGPRWTGRKGRVKTGPCEGDFAFMFFHYFFTVFHFCNVFLLFFFFAFKYVSLRASVSEFNF